MKRLNLQIYEKFVDSYARSEFKIRPSDSDDLSRLFLKLVRSEHLEIYRVVLNHWSKKLIIQQQLLALSRFSSFNNRIFRDPIRTEWVDDGRRTKFVDYWVELHDREFLLKTVLRVIVVRYQKVRNFLNKFLIWLPVYSVCRQARSGMLMPKCNSSKVEIFSLYHQVEVLMNLQAEQRQSLPFLIELQDHPKKYVILTRFDIRRGWRTSC